MGLAYLKPSEWREVWRPSSCNASQFFQTAYKHNTLEFTQFRLTVALYSVQYIYFYKQSYVTISFNFNMMKPL